jgi:hypothetical protein
MRQDDKEKVMRLTSRVSFTVAGAVTLLIAVGCATLRKQAVEERPALGAGFRYSEYGPDYNPGPQYWLRVGQEMAARFPGSKPETIWIVSRLKDDGTVLNFPVENAHPLITGSETDENEAVLDLFDRHGFRVWLQAEPGHAPVEELIHLILGRYKHHPSVVGFGLDVEWFESTEQPEGRAVTDAEASAWLEAVRQHDPDYRLFLKHWEAGMMPPTVREGLFFIDDRPWWSELDDPPGDIGRAILDRVANTEGLYWVDFTVLELFPPGPDDLPPPEEPGEENAP